jgi:hypothetical protein
MRLTQLVEAAAKFVELPHPKKFPIRGRGDRDKLIGMLLDAIDENTGIGWAVDPGYAWEKQFKQMGIEKQIERDIFNIYSSKHELAVEYDDEEERVYYGALMAIYDDEKLNFVQYQKVTSPTTGRDGWKFILKPPKKEAKAKADQAVTRYMKERAQLSRKR